MPILQSAMYIVGICRILFRLVKSASSEYDKKKLKEILNELDKGGIDDNTIKLYAKKLHEREKDFIP